MSSLIGGTLLISALTMAQPGVDEIATNKVIDVPSGTVVCISRQSALDFAEASATNNESKINWIMSGACAKLPSNYSNQKLIAEEDNIRQISLSNGRWKLDRFIPSI